MTICFGTALGDFGAVRRISVVRGFELRARHEIIDPLEFAITHAAPVALNFGHDSRRLLGRCQHLELDMRGRMWSVCDVYGDTVDLRRGYAYSVEASGAPPTMRVSGLAVTDMPAAVGVGHVLVLDVPEIAQLPASVPRRLAAAGERHLAGLLERAAAATRNRGRDAPIVLHDVDVERGKQRARRVAQEREMLERAAFDVQQRQMQALFEAEDRLHGYRAQPRRPLSDYGSGPLLYRPGRILAVR